MNTPKHTPGPWRWQGEDYRGGWGWQLLVGANGEGIACGERCGHPYEHLRAFQAIDPALCKTGMSATSDSAPGIHIQQGDARLIAAAPDLLEALRGLLAAVQHSVCENSGPAQDAARAAIAKATGGAT
jgi:hypothetical protein